MTPMAQKLYDEAIVPALNALGLDRGTNLLTASRLVLGTAAHESEGFKFRHQIHGPALGLFQIEPATHVDLYVNFLAFRPAMEGDLSPLLRPGVPAVDQLVDNDPYAAAVCRLVYYRAKPPLPTDPEDVAALAAYWNEWYNRNPLKGTDDQFINDYHRYVGGNV